VVVAHPDDEYHFAVTLYRIVRELGGTVDQTIITDGAGGHRYSQLAEVLYGLPLQSPGTNLRDVRRAETAVSGHVLGIRQHFFLDQPDTGFTCNVADAIADWNHCAVTEHLDDVLDAGRYDFVFTLLPRHDTHGHHKAAAMLTLEAVNRLAEKARPVVLAGEAFADVRTASKSPVLAHPSLRLANQQYSVSRTQPHSADPALSYQIIANWVVAAHKSQGLFQMESGRHDAELFWRFENGVDGDLRTHTLFRRLQPPTEAVSVPA
jgi:LmbE family N-acetylglucosaminyl deacetylase